MRVVTVPAALERIGITRAECIRLAATMQEDVSTQQPILDWKKKLEFHNDEVERLVLQ